MSLKIMVVEDESVSLKLISSLAAPAGHTVLTFDDSQEAGQREKHGKITMPFSFTPWGV
jgi:CheY-like chemotaxis protein